MKVGFIGLGRMGAAMAANLLKAGHEVTVYNRSADKAQAMATLGARVAARVADACRAEAVITMLANDEAVHSVVFDDAGVLASAERGGLHISMSTISVGLSARLTAAHTAAGQRFVAAPVFGRPEAAAAAQLFIVAAGARAAVDACAPLFSAMGQKVFNLGDEPSAANLVKLSGNFLIASVIEALGEAMALIGEARIDKRSYLELLTSTLFNVPLYKIYGGLIVEQKFEPAGFAAPLGLKDIRLTLAAAEELRVPMPLASLLRDRFLTLLARGGEAMDWSAISQLSALDAGQKSGLS
ncbi:MAG TPA: NAD(P)-dependent oxidoreductase [Steroidobacteraceae bacterium]|jgi:3-hydroxyisobutyrate dehydrogenase-like beta-hydroxyacid dehydrogenase|nr:NAD(P)-dependent oxidoreductase [Steroidobacteraceae bacterium]